MNHGEHHEPFMNHFPAPLKSAEALEIYGDQLRTVENVDKDMALLG